MEIENKIKCVLIDFEQGEITLNETSNTIFRLFSVSGSLPTDEEISKQARKYDVEDLNDAISRIGGFVVGAKWMRDLISGNDH